MTHTVHNLRLLALIAAIAAGLLIEAKAGESQVATKDCFEMSWLI